MNLGYACLAMGVPDAAISRCLLKDASEEKLMAVSRRNLAALERMIDYNIRSGILLFRISSDLIPLGSHPVNRSPWRRELSAEFDRIGRKIRVGGIRVSMHPGQYTVLNSPNDSVAENAAADLRYHADVLDLLGVDFGSKIVLHIGGAYGDKKKAKAAFLANFGRLAPDIRSRLVVENDDRHFTVEDALEISASACVPVVFDNLHHALNPPESAGSEGEWIALCGATWRPGDGRQKIHYSQPRSGGRRGAHADTIALPPFLEFVSRLPENPPDMMLEVKDKNLSAVKCAVAMGHPVDADTLDEEWNRYEDFVLSRSEALYERIQGLLQKKSSPDPVCFYHLVDKARELSENRELESKAAMAVWHRLAQQGAGRGEKEKKRFESLMRQMEGGRVSPVAVRNFLYGCAEARGDGDLLQSYYFYL